MANRVKNKCKSCTTSVKLTHSELKELLSLNGDGLDPSLLTSTKTYFKRMSQCETCPDLQYETTCRYNGMLVQYMTRIENKGCPAPGGARW